MSDKPAEPQWLPILHQYAQGRSGAEIPRDYSGHARPHFRRCSGQWVDGYYQDNETLTRLYAGHCGDLARHALQVGTDSGIAAHHARDAAHWGWILLDDGSDA